MKVGLVNRVSVMPKISISRPAEVQNLSVDTRNISNGIFLSFTSNPSKNMAQVASIAPEYQGILNPVYKLGGLGNVAGEASIAFSENGGMDFRSFIPYYAPDNKSGGIKVRTPLMKDGIQEQWSIPKMAGNVPLMKDGEPVLEQIPAYTFKSVPIDYVLQEGEAFVIHEPISKTKPWNTDYEILEDIGIKGTVESVSDNLEDMVETPYKVFKVRGTEAGKPGNPPVYIVHTPELAKFPKAYGGAVGAYGGGTFEDAHYGIFSKAAIDAMPKLNDEKFGDFNPGNFWLHDRQAFPSLVEISEKSANGDEYWRGIKAHSSFHNPGRNYQGHYKNPIDFMRIIGSKEDLAELQKNEADYTFVKTMIKKIEDVRKEGKKFSPEDILSKEELQKLNEIFKPLYGGFVDETGEYNLCKIPVAGVRKNPYNFSAGTVSTTFGKEMKNHNTTEIAYGLTTDFASIPTVDIVNGSASKSMSLGVIGNFGAKGNGFTDEVKQGFTPLTQEVKSSSDLLFAAKQSNKKWLIDTISSHAEKGELQELFFNKDAIEKGSTVLGELSPYKDKDVLFVGWGRPDPQKGFPTTLEGILSYFKNDSVNPETKEHAKFLIGAGPWGKDAPDWKTIQEQIKEVQELDSGRYKGNVCYINGFFSNRVVACADYANITSRYEPCGITPLEAYAGGTPVISNKTGGSPDFIIPFKQGQEITNETGFLTKNAYLVNPEVIGAQKGLEGAALDSARRIALGKENAQCIEQAVDLIQQHPEDYKKMMTNAVTSKIDWHENITFNGGKSAIERYKEAAWAIGSDNKVLAGEERNMQPLANLKGHINIIEKIKNVVQDTQENIKTAGENLGENVKNSSNSLFGSLKNHKALCAIGACVVALAGIIYALSAKNKKPEVMPDNVVPITKASSNNSINTIKKSSFNSFATGAKK